MADGLLRRRGQLFNKDNRESSGPEALVRVGRRGSGSYALCGIFWHGRYAEQVEIERHRVGFRFPHTVSSEEWAISQRMLVKLF